MTSPAMPPLPRFRGPKPFRLGVTSYVYPADIIPNVEAVAGWVDDVELVFFESPDVSNIPSPADVERLAALARAHKLTYTVHLPIDRKLGSESPAERQAMVDQSLRIIDLVRPLEPYAYLLHIEGIADGAAAGRVARWQADVMPLLERFARAVPDAARICVENLGYPFEWCDPLLAAFPFSVCTDLGHLWERGYDWRRHLALYLGRTRVVHLYGPGEGSRHLSLATAPPERAREFASRIEGYSGVLTLETFGYDDTSSSIEALMNAQRIPG